jgi:hypothetical protein
LKIESEAKIVILWGASYDGGVMQYGGAQIQVLSKSDPDVGIHLN